MRTLESALSSFSKTLGANPLPNGEPIQGLSTDGMQNGLTASGTALPDTTTALIAQSPSSEIGRALGRIGAIERPRTAKEAAELAVKLVADLLPPSMDLWLAAQERKALDGLEVYPPVPKPERTPEMLECLTQAMKSLSEITKPAGHTPAELSLEVAKLFAGFNLYTGDAAKMATQVEVWGDELSEFPPYAIRTAFRWALRGGERLPSLASVIADVRLAVGSKVLTRKRLIQQYLAEGARQ